MSKLDQTMVLLVWAVSALAWHYGVRRNKLDAFLLGNKKIDWLWFISSRVSPSDTEQLFLKLHKGIITLAFIILTLAVLINFAVPFFHA